MYHCGTKPVLAHIADGMYGAIIVDPAKALAAGDSEFVLVSSEWYLNGDGVRSRPPSNMSRRGDEDRLGDLQRVRQPVRRRTR